MCVCVSVFDFVYLRMHVCVLMFVCARVCTYLCV